MHVQPPHPATHGFHSCAAAGRVSRAQKLPHPRSDWHVRAAHRDSLSVPTKRPGPAEAVRTCGAISRAHGVRAQPFRQRPPYLANCSRNRPGPVSECSSLQQEGPPEKPTVEAIRPSRERGLEPAYICPYKNVQSTLVQIGKTLVQTFCSGTKFCSGLLNNGRSRLGQIGFM